MPKEEGGDDYWEIRVHDDMVDFGSEWGHGGSAKYSELGCLQVLVVPVLQTRPPNLRHGQRR